MALGPAGQHWIPSRIQHMWLIYVVICCNGCATYIQYTYIYVHIMLTLFYWEEIHGNSFFCSFKSMLLCWYFCRLPWLRESGALLLLQAFVQENGQCLFATKPYKLSEKTLGKNFDPPVHVTWHSNPWIWSTVQRLVFKLKLPQALCSWQP